MNKIVIFGAGYLGKYALRFFGEDNVFGFVDNDKNRWGQEYLGKKIYKPDELLQMEHLTKVVIANYAHVEIQQQLEKVGIEDSVVFLMDYVVIKRALKKVHGKVLLVTDGENDIFHKYIDFHLAYVPIEICHFSVREFQKIDEKERNTPVYIYSKKHHAEIHYLLRNEENVTDIGLWILWDDEEMLHCPTKDEWENGYDEDNYLKTMFEIGMVDAMDNYVNMVIKNKEVPLFKLIELETINRCNSVCAFCAANANAPQRPKKYMSDELFYKIIKELKNLDFRGQVCMFSANEPFLDPNIVERVKYAKIHLPKAKINITTNGTLLTLEKYLAVIDYVDEFVVNNYTTERKVRSNLNEIIEYCNKHQEKDYKEKTKIVIRKIDEKLSARAGNSPNRKEAIVINGHSCAMVYQQMVISPDGKVRLCSSDVMGQCIVGDVSVDSLIDTWYGEKMNDIRKELVEGRRKVSICEKCDFFHIY